MRASILGYSALPVGTYQRRKDGTPGPLEHELAAQVVPGAVESAGISREDIDGVVVAHPGDHTWQGYFHTFVTSYLGIAANATVIQTLGNGMTGGHAFDEAVRLVDSGRANCVLVIGIHFESGTPTSDHLDYSIRLTGDVDFQSIFGAVPIAWYGMAANRYMHQHQTTRAQIAQVAVKNRRQAAHNGLAQFRDELTLEQVLAQRMIVEPLGLLEVPGRADGALAVIVGNPDIARETGKPSVRILGRGFDHEGEHQIADRHVDFLAYEPLPRAAGRAFEEAGVKLGDMDLFQIYAPCTIVEIAASEAIGLFERGKGWKASADGTSAFDGTHPINTSGGCLSRGHPPEITPLYDIIETCEQVLDRAGKRQVTDARLGLTSCELGHYNAALVHVLEGVA